MVSCARRSRIVHPLRHPVEDSEPSRHGQHLLENIPVAHSAPLGLHIRHPIFREQSLPVPSHSSPLTYATATGRSLRPSAQAIPAENKVSSTPNIPSNSSHPSSSAVVNSEPPHAGNRDGKRDHKRDAPIIGDTPSHQPYVNVNPSLRSSSFKTLWPWRTKRVPVDSEKNKRVMVLDYSALHKDAQAVYEHQWEGPDSCRDHVGGEPGHAGALDSWTSQDFQEVISDLCLVHCGAFFRQEPILTFARSRSELHQKLLSIIEDSSSSSVSVDQLVRFHDLHPSDLRSTRSYNVLIAWAIHHTQFTLARHLLQQMNGDSIERSSFTTILSLRLLVRSGHWEQAWLEVYAAVFRPARHQLGEPGKPGSYALWLEMFAQPRWRKQRRLAQPRPAIEGWPRPMAPVRFLRVRATPVDVEASRLERVLTHRPALPEHPPDARVRVTYAIAHALCRLGYQDHAANITKDYLHGLPFDLDDTTRRWCMKLVHLHAFREKTSLIRPHKSFFRARKTVETLLGCHPALRPTPNTLFLLIGHLKSASTPVLHARRLITRYRQKYGEDIVDAYVVRRMASFFLHERKLLSGSKMLQQVRKRCREEAVMAIYHGVVGDQLRVPALVQETPSTHAGIQVRPRWGRERAYIKRLQHRFDIQKARWGRRKGDV
jgi:hypothetical protein